MSSRKLQKQIWRELKRISENIPSELLENLMKKEKLTPDLKTLVQKATGLPESEITPEQRERFQVLLDSGYLDREVDVLNFDTEELISQYFEAEIALAVKAGRLPKEAPLPDFIKKKGLKYARKQKRRLEELYRAASGDEEDAPLSDSDDARSDREREHSDRVPSSPSEQGAGQGEAGQAAAETSAA